MSTILLIEDEQNVADIIKKGLEEDGYSVVHKKEGSGGIEALGKTFINLVILDILLLGINGLEICKRIQDLGYEELPILMLIIATRRLWMVGLPYHSLKLWLGLLF